LDFVIKKKEISMKFWLVFTLSLLSGFLYAAPNHISNVRGYTLNNNGVLISFSDLVFDSGKVLAIGNSALSKKFPHATLIDGQNKVLLPGMIDAHGHVMGVMSLGESLVDVDLRDVKTASKAVQQVRHYANANPALKWITGGGWNEVLWPDKAFPNAKQLDEYVPDRPVMLSRVDGHSSWVNSKALEIAQITKETLDPPGGKIIRDTNGNPTGVLIDNAMELMFEHVPKNSEAYLKSKLDAAGQHLLSMGITSAHDAGISKAEYDYYIKRQAAHTLPLRFYPMLWAPDPQFKAMLEKGYVQDQYDFLSIRSVKAMADGSLGSRGAAMLAPYNDAPDNRGLMTLSENDYKPLFDLVLSRGFQLNVHAIGDRANRMVLDQFEESFKRIGGQTLRNRMEHAQVIALEDIPRFLNLNIIPSMQPTHATSDKNMAETRIGKERLKGAYAWQTFLKQGSPLAFGSDFPVEFANPFYGLHAAVTRQDRQNLPKDGWYPDESISIEQAFRAFTLDAAYSAHQDKILGGLTVGKWADFILVDQDIFKIPSKDIWRTQVLQTWIGGEQRFKK
jgi:predicted amidohydrolase YtcJ